MLASLLSQFFFFFFNERKKEKEQKRRTRRRRKKKKKKKKRKKGHQHRPIIVRAIRDFGYEDTVCIANNEREKRTKKEKKKLCSDRSDEAPEKLAWMESGYEDLTLLSTIKIILLSIVCCIVFVCIVIG